jgi:hypothetical protein
MADVQLAIELEGFPLRCFGSLIDQTGYKRMRAQLELQGYWINEKKVYRLMKKEDLLLARRWSERGLYVTHRCDRPDKPLIILEMDIRMFWDTLR